MRRTTKALAALVTAGAVIMSITGPAWAADGVLVVSGNRFVDPDPGCYRGRFWPLTVNNRTNTAVFIFDGDTCQGDPLGVVRPGEVNVFEYGHSVYVPG
ncbi:hypothetical protein ACFY19_16390 [Streptosporangium saharense]|uniref:Secreted protein n=1 Tax=Streptosporangium saharense TaxID=1706840 RepID=A0A7W7VNM7_9ACTN|nr:hypothetical protein [Streptosporangium saharense]MBB4917007.1 hypothetical protein [Streptosporangium saharense]